MPSLRIFNKPALISVLCAALTACGGGADNPFSAPGIDSGSASASYQETTETEPTIGAALPQPLDDEFDAIRFLHRSSFGPTSDSIDTLIDSGYARYIDSQLLLPPTFLLPVTRQRNEPRWLEHINSWLKNSVNAPDQLRQRVAYSLSQFFVVSSEGELGGHPNALANYYDILLANSFGNFRDLMEQVTLSPVMGNYLSMKGNQKSDSDNNIRQDENYARELLQLFSIGLVKLNPNGTVVVDEDNIPVPTYNQETVENFARVFTGWNFKDVDNWDYPKNEDWFSPMQAYDEKHDKGEKTLLNGRVLPAGQSAEQDLTDALDNIFNHPNVGPFLSKHLIKQLVTSNPSPDYVERVAATFNANKQGIRGDLASVIAAVLLDEEAINGYHRNPQQFGKLREPIIRLVALWRAFEANPDHPEFAYAWIGSRLAQAPLQAPSVFNFFSASFSQPGVLRDGGLLSPEFEIHNESTMISITSSLLAHSVWRNNLSDDDPSKAPINISQLVELDGNTDEQLAYLSRLILGAPMSQGLHQQALYLLEERSRSNSLVRAEDLLFLFLSSPEAAVQR